MLTKTKLRRSHETRIAESPTPGILNSFLAAQKCFKILRNYNDIIITNIHLMQMSLKEFLQFYKLQFPLLRCLDSKDVYILEKHLRTSSSTTFLGILNGRL